MVSQKKNLLEVLKGYEPDHVPFWFMRQAGRYLPEYRKLRAEAGGFLDMVYNPEFAAEVTLQPIRRFGMDGAIIFSDILVTPQAMGQKLEFVQGEGPKLEPIREASQISKLNFSKFDETLSPIYETIARVKSGLQEEGFGGTTTLGFAGAPWTVACYMVEGGSSKDFLHVKTMAYRDEKMFSELIDMLVECTASYLINQIKAGAEAVQIFDSWASAVDASQFRKWVISPTRKIVDLVRDVYPDVPIIGFPRAVGHNYLAYIQDTGVSAVSMDQQLDTKWAARTLQSMVPVQGNLDPVALLAGGDALVMAIEKIITDFSDGPFIFNLGHGINKETPVEHVELAVKTIRDLGKKD